MAGRLPLPLTPADRPAGYWWELSLRQVEVSRTLVFDAPRQARAFFEALIADNLDLGRPDTSSVFSRRPARPPARHPGGRSRPVISRGDDVTINAFCAIPGSSST